MSFIASFHAANPGCEITLVEGVPVRLSEMLLQGELDLAVMASPRRSTSGSRFSLYTTSALHRISDRASAGPAKSRRGLGCCRRDLPASDQLRIPRLSCRPAAFAGAGCAGWVPERARGLDPDDGGGRVRGLLPARILAEHPRPPHTAGDRSRGGSEVSLVSMSGRRFSPAVMSFIRAIRSHDWAPGGIAETA
jgi:LysR family transcriptional regulator, hydrogen peroxide-inducible genes activator